ncbi:MAG: hypothetical protein ACTTJW_04950 [Sphaerochaeta sp.]
MRTFTVYAVLILLLAVPCALFGAPWYEAGRAELGFGADLASAQDIFLGKGSFHIAADIRMTVSEEFQIRIPLGFSINRTSQLWETGFDIVCYPWGAGPFISLSLFRAGFSRNCENIDSMVNLNEVSIGWTFEFGPELFVEPCLCVRDPSGTFTEEYSRIKGTFPCYTTFRGRIAFGWMFLR